MDMKPGDPGQMSAHEDFSPLEFPLSGMRLIEASAGTGKTYNIANLFLRLIVGHGIEQALEVDQILVVTFTRAATSELRGRIRARVEQAFHDFRRGHSDEAEINALIPESVDERTRMIRLLNQAILRMDEASISTIHSFAVQAARTFLFETGAIADIEISEYGEAVTTRIVTDLYRYLATLSGEFAQEFKKSVLGSLSDVRKFQQYYQDGLPRDCRIEPASALSSDLPGLYRQYQQRCSVLAQAHRDHSQQWRERFPYPAKVDHREFCVDVADRFNEELHAEFSKEYKLVRSATNLANYLQAQLQGDSINYEDKRGSAFYRKWQLIPDEAGSGACFSILLQLRDHFENWFDLQLELKQAGPVAVLETLRERQADIQLDQLSLDDVIRLINQKLADPETADALRRIITQTYPACLVDEFQDTDPEQFLMFNSIYSQAEQDTGFFMIGDPKQSIYSFRGADIFSYLKVRNSVRHQEDAENDRKIFSLNTNWRSKKALVEASNQLFREPVPSGPDPVFLFPGIAYQAVESCEQTRGQNKGVYSIGNGGQSSDRAMVFVGNPDSGEEALINGTTLMRKYARDTAARISALLNRDSGGRVTDESGVATPLAPGNIAVLVRSGREARHIREELAQPGIGIRSVYLSQKDSVFRDAEISEDIYQVLLAIHEYSNKNSLKAALATPLMRGFTFEFAELDRLEDDDNALESLIEEFAAYQQLWQHHGILTALNHLLDKRGLFSAIAKRQDSDRIFTDLRHLGDLLQQQHMQSGSAEQLIDWYASQLNDDSLLDEDSKRIRLESDEDLVKIVTIFVAKGLEYPVVFLPFFFLHKPINLSRNLPLYHDQDADFRAVVDFSSDPDVGQRMAKEALAEDMRLLYVAVTRAIYQCYMGISASTHNSNRNNVFAATHWAHLLGVEDPRPEWATIQAALQQRFGDGQSVDYCELGDVAAEKFEPSQNRRSVLALPDPTVCAPVSFWQIASYSRLAHGGRFQTDDKGDDEVTAVLATEEAQEEQLQAADDQRWGEDIRYTLKGSSVTGSCLHDIFEEYGLDPEVDFRQLAEKLLARYGLDRPARPRAMTEADYLSYSDAFPGRVAAWLQAALVQPLENPVVSGVPSLKHLFSSREVIPELAFDFAMGSGSSVLDVADINRALQGAGLAGLEIDGDRIHGLMTGAIDLVFVHDQKIFMLDYKSNTLGRAPRFYDQAGMSNAMTQNRFDLQYTIYSTAVHRYFSSRFAEQYAFDEQAGKSLSFGGVFYLFLRGMGLSEKPYRQHGVWFTRPESGHISALDNAFRGSGSRR